MTTTLGLFDGSVPTSAHELEESNGVNAVFHINPDDNPVAGTEKVGVYFLFARRDGQFALSDYKLSLNVKFSSGASKKYDLMPAFFGTATKGYAMVDFPTANVYDLVVIGTAKSIDAKNFALDFPIRVTGGMSAVTAHKSNPSITVIIGLTIGIMLLMAATANIRRGGRYANVKAKE